MDRDRPTAFVVDDDHTIRESIELVLRSVEVPVRTFASAWAFLDWYDPDAPGCLVTDIVMPGMSGIDLQSELRVRKIGLPIVFITGHGDIPLAVKVMKAGAFDFFEKPVDCDRLLACIRDAFERDRIERQVARAHAEVRRRIERLTPREFEVFERVVAGHSSRRIAAELKVSAKTIEAHRAQVMRKMEARNVVDLIHAWYRCPGLHISAGD